VAIVIVLLFGWGLGGNMQGQAAQFGQQGGQIRHVGWHCSLRRSHKISFEEHDDVRAQRSTKGSCAGLRSA
jgi:hypothetical protein